MATISSRLDDQGNWVSIESETSGAFSKQMGGEEESPITSFSRALKLAASVSDQVSLGLSGTRGVDVSFSIKIMPTGEVLISKNPDGGQFKISINTGR